MTKKRKRHFLRRKFLADLKWTAKNPGAGLQITSKEAQAILELVIVAESI